MSLQARLMQQKPTEIKIPAIVKGELLLGARKRGSENLKKYESAIRDLLSPFEVVAFDDEASEIYCEIRASLEQTGKVVGPNDLLIASTVLSYRGTLVSHNVKEFSQIVGLNIQDWVDA